MATDRQELQRLAAFLARRFPEVDATAPVATAIALLEHLWRVEQMTPPVLRTLHASRLRARQAYVDDGCVSSK